MKYHNTLTKSGSLTSLVQCYYLICIPSSVFAGCPSNVSSPPPRLQLPLLLLPLLLPSSSSSPPRLILPLLFLLRAIVFFWSRVQPRITCCTQSSCLFSFLWSGTAPQPFFVFHDTVFLFLFLIYGPVIV